jgi:hypothetical protein
MIIILCRRNIISTYSGIKPEVVICVVKKCPGRIKYLPPAFTGVRRSALAVEVEVGENPSDASFKV